jgi:predicted RNase H-like HicB family nuclease
LRRRRKDYKEVLANVEVIVREWIEGAKELGRPISAPRSRTEGIPCCSA